MAGRRLMALSAADAQNFNAKLQADTREPKERAAMGLQGAACDVQAVTCAGTTGYCRLYKCARTADCWSTAAARAFGQRFLVADRATSACCRGGKNRPPSAANGQAHRYWLGERSLACAPLDDRWPPALAAAGGETCGPSESCGIRFSQWLFDAHRSRFQA